MNITYAYNYKRTVPGIDIVKLSANGTASILESLNAFPYRKLEEQFVQDYNPDRGINIIMEDGTLYQRCYAAIRMKSDFFFVKDDFTGIYGFLKRHPYCYVRNGKMDYFDVVLSKNIYAVEYQK